MRLVGVVAALSLLAGMAAAGLAGADDQAKKSEPRAEKQAKKDDARLEAVLESIDMKQRTITVRVGKSVDEVLSEMLRHPGEQPKVDGGKKQVLPLANHVNVTISFRSSPSVANHVERQLSELDKMIGYPVTIAPKGGPVNKIVAWRGTPWKITPSK